MNFIFQRLFLLNLLLLCAVFYSTAQSFSSLKKNAEADYNSRLVTLLDQNDASGLREYLKANPSKVNDATVIKKTDNMRIAKPVPLIYDAVYRTLNGASSVKVCQVIIDADCNLNNPFDGKTTIYIVLDFIATHPKSECDVAEQILALILARSDFDVNFRYQSLLPPFSYLIRENHSYLKKFSPDYISDNVLKLFLEKGVSINTYDNEGNSLMAFAVETENMYLQTYFIDNGIDLNKQNKSGNDALFLSIEKGNLPLVKRIIQETGLVLDENNLKNPPSSFEKYPELYQYVSQLCAEQAVKYKDIFALQKFADKFNKSNSLPQIYKRQEDLISNISDIRLLQRLVREYPHSANSNVLYWRQVSLIENESNNALEQIQKGTYSGSEYKTPIEQFIEQYKTNDIGNKISMAQHTLNLVLIVRGVRLAESSVYYNWVKRKPLKLFQNYYEYEAENRSSYDNTISDAFTALNSVISYDKTAQHFVQAKAYLEQQHQMALANYRRDEQRAIEMTEMARAESLQREVEYQQRMCDDCEINENKTRYPYTDKDFLGFTRNNPGRFVMLNGKMQEFYYEDGQWYTVTGFIFTSRTKYNFIGDLKDDFIKKCKEMHCK